MVVMLLSLGLAAGVAGKMDLPHGDDEVYLSLEGTIWSATDSDGERWMFHFEKGGILHYGLNGPTYRNGTWRQDGMRLYMETNKRYAEFHGTIRGDRIVGRAANVARKHWTWAARPGGDRKK